MTSIPQLRADINDLQVKLAAALARVKELETAGPIVVTEKVPFETVRIEYRDKVVEVPVYITKTEYVDRVTEVQDTKSLAAKDAEIERLKSEVAKIKEDLRAAKKKPAREKIVYRDREVMVPFETVRIEYRDKVVEVPGPDRVIEVIKEVPGPVVKEYIDRPMEIIKEIPGPERVVEIIKYIDNPDHIAMIKQLQSRLRKLEAK